MYKMVSIVRGCIQLLREKSEKRVENEWESINVLEFIVASSQMVHSIFEFQSTSAAEKLLRQTLEKVEKWNR